MCGSTGGIGGPDIPWKILSNMCFYRNKHLDPPPPPEKVGPPLNLIFVLGKLLYSHCYLSNKIQMPELKLLHFKSKK